MSLLHFLNFVKIASIGSITTDCGIKSDKFTTLNLPSSGFVRGNKFELAWYSGAKYCLYKFISLSPKPVTEPYNPFAANDTPPKGMDLSVAYDNKSPLPDDDTDYQKKKKQYGLN